VYEFGNAPQLGSASNYACRGTVGMTCVDTKPEQACNERPSCLMAPNDSWAPGTQRRVCNGGRFVHQADGNIVFFDKHERVVWQWGSTGATHSLNMQPDGNLVLYRPQGPTSAGTNGNPGAWLEVQNCNLMIRRLDGQVVWHSNTTCPPPPPSPVTGGAVLPNNTFLPVGHALVSPTGNAQVQLQGDGNVVVWAYDGAGWQALWQTHTSGYPSTGLVMQHDGNLVQYGAGGAYWASGTPGNLGAWAQIQDDCNFAVYRPGPVPIWSSNTRCPARLPARFALRVASGHIVAAENGGGGLVIANRTGIGPWETFTKFGGVGGRVALRTATGHFLQALNGGGLNHFAAFHAQATGIGEWESFTVENLGGNLIALRTWSGHYVSAHLGGNAVLVTDRVNRGAWETFEVIPLP
jgi:hypothetical protein